MMVVMDNASKRYKENFNMKMKDDKRVSTLVQISGRVFLKNEEQI